MAPDNDPKREAPHIAAYREQGQKLEEAERYNERLLNTISSFTEELDIAEGNLERLMEVAMGIEGASITTYHKRASELHDVVDSIRLRPRAAQEVERLLAWNARLWALVNKAQPHSPEIADEWFSEVDGLTKAWERHTPVEHPAYAELREVKQRLGVETPGV